MSETDARPQPVGRFAALRPAMIAAAVLGIVLGLVMLFWPGITLVLTAVFFGVALIVAGGSRIAFALSSVSRPPLRLLMGVLGVLMVLAGALCLIRPVRSLLFVIIMIGLSWILSGIFDAVAGAVGGVAGSRLVAIIAGVLSVIAGVVVLALPGLALDAFVTLGGILLVVVSILTLANLPQSSPRA